MATSSLGRYVICRRKIKMALRREVLELFLEHLDDCNHPLVLSAVARVHICASHVHLFDADVCQRGM